jgi:2-keto-4-pentenoate hydratase/2-oxohepta-3-ene-1,7-dioic acid hydratase in catechol pathway
MRTYPPAIFAIGRNYAEHAAEMAPGVAPPERPVVFMKNPASVIGDGEAIVIPRICEEPGCGDPAGQVDYEGELAVIIARPGRDIAEHDAAEFIAGYAIANDVSARWWQKHGSGGQFVRGKSFDTFCPLGAMTPREKVHDPHALDIRTCVNGEVMQEANTAEMIFSVPKLVSELSRGTTLLGGTVILTGTPAGVGAARTPPRFLREGDVVEISIRGLGKLRNPVVREAPV